MTRCFQIMIYHYHCITIGEETKAGGELIAPITLFYNNGTNNLEKVRFKWGTWKIEDMEYNGYYEGSELLKKFAIEEFRRFIRVKDSVYPYKYTDKKQKATFYANHELERFML